MRAGLLINHMQPNPFLGVIYHWIGGLMAGSFYIPYRGVKKWSWETYWLVGGFFSWIIAPWLLAWLLVPGFIGVLQQTPMNTIEWVFFFGLLWGIGGLTFGLTMRYLGIALGVAVALGFCATFGTLVPPIFDRTFGLLTGEASGRMVLLGVTVCLVGITVSGLAGMSKERELTDEQKKSTVSEFSFVKGILVAACSGILSACFSYGLQAGKPISIIAKASLLQNHRADLWQNLPVLPVILLGGFTTNFAWCVFLNFKNGTGREYFDANAGKTSTTAAAPMLPNYVLCAVAGVTWYFQFFFYSMGATRMGRYDFSSWTLHMASIIIFSTLWGVALKEWKGTSKRTHVLIGTGLALLVASTIIVGYGNYLKSLPTVQAIVAAPEKEPAERSRQ